MNGLTKQKYHWLGINKAGARLNGTIEASTDADAHAELEKNGIEVIKLIKNKKSSSSLFGFKFFTKTKIKKRDILLFTRYLSTMLSAGLPITQSLEIISHDQSNTAMQGLISSIHTSIEGGKTLAESFKKHPKYFDNLYCSLVNAGEQSGTLDKILVRIANYLERNENLKRKIKKALIYPIAIIIVALIVSSVLLIFVVPQFEKMFKSFGAELPLFTRSVLYLSHFIRDYWWMIIVAFIGLSYFIKKSIQNSDYLQYQIDKWMLRIYIIGPILSKGIQARFTRTLATTLAAGMPIVESIQTLSGVVDNRIYKDKIEGLCNDIRTGHPLSTSLGATNLFPNMAIQMIAVGEVSGSLEAMLNRIADYIEEEVNTIVDSLSSLLEPMIMLVLGIVIGGFVIAMYVPIFKLGSLF